MYDLQDLDAEELETLGWQDIVAGATGAAKGITDGVLKSVPQTKGVKTANDITNSVLGGISAAFGGKLEELDADQLEELAGKGNWKAIVNKSVTGAQKITNGVLSSVPQTKGVKLANKISTGVLGTVASAFSEMEDLDFEDQELFDWKQIVQKAVGGAQGITNGVL